jgi:hypothetical protein
LERFDLLDYTPRGYNISLFVFEIKAIVECLQIAEIDHKTFTELFLGDYWLRI